VRLIAQAPRQAAHVAVQVKPLHAALLQGRDDVTASFNVRLAGRRTGYLLFFTEMSETNESAISGAAKFTPRS
jgi:hypothetical protein